MIVSPGDMKGEAHAPSIRISDAVLVVIVGFALGLIGAAFVILIARVLLDAPRLDDIVTYSLSSVLIYGGCLLSTYIFVIDRRGVTWERVGLRRPTKAFILAAIGTLAAVIVVNGMIATVVAELVSEPPDVREQLSLSERERLSAPEIVWLVFALVIAAPVVEEVVFRGLLFAAFRRTRAFPWAAVVSALIFAAVHLSPTLIPTLFVLGLALAWLYDRYDSLYPPILLHALNNGLAVTVLVAVS